MAIVQLVQYMSLRKPTISCTKTAFALIFFDTLCFYICFHGLEVICFKERGGGENVIIKGLERGKRNCSKREVVVPTL